MKYLKLIALVFVASGLVLTTSCKKDNDDDQSEKELTINALVNGSWSIDDASETDAAGVDLTAVTINFTAGSDVNFTLSGGDIENFVSGGSLTVSEAGALTATITVVSEELEAGSASATLNGTKTTFTLNFQTAESTSRVTGLGDYDLVFTLDQ